MALRQGLYKEYQNRKHISEVLTVISDSTFPHRTDILAFTPFF